ncbi:hypothetical protein F4777DRAFT_535373 [Nemania sp. FL0916]|nr:hypothetical protein F4777DRAFT_535373 [Nemania sp. FL0916]
MMGPQHGATIPHTETTYRFVHPGLEVAHAHPGLEVLPQAYPNLEVASTPLEPSKVNQSQFPSTVRQERGIFSVRRGTVFLSAVVIIAVAIGGAVGGSLAVKNAKSACSSNGSSEATVVTTTQTALPTPTPAAGPLVVTRGVVQLDCPGLPEQISIQLIPNSSAPWIFTSACNIDYPGYDLAEFIAYSFHDCLQACAAYNAYKKEDDCRAITFVANQTATPNGNCWLKNHNFTSGSDGDPDYVNLIASAKFSGRGN